MMSFAAEVLFTFFIFLELLIYLYILTSWLPLSYGFKNKLNTLINPILEPIRYILKRSIFNTPIIDLSPVIGLVIITFIQQMIILLK
ncbi:MAG: hypothetical protein K0R21_991 [Anaerocolumna sp.]|jgi:uncharacterized protein YggT (Ycf19 family)|nr:hypothetical protein [Anaerocolumna sp.]